jgi:hypothetical protein
MRLLPPVLRARDFHLYLEGGRRLTDLWQNGGRAILGHKPPGVIREMKNAAERGLFVPFPHPMEKRFIKALSLLLPGRVFRLYDGEGSLRRALEEAALPSPPLWRPFTQPPADTLLRPSLPWPLAPLVLAAEQETLLPQGDLVVPVLLAAATRAIHDLVASDGRGEVRYPKVEKALAREGCEWKQEGIYLWRPETTGEEWVEIWKRFLEAGFLLPPEKGDPLILPGTMSPGEEAKLAETLSTGFSAL